MSQPKQDENTSMHTSFSSTGDACRPVYFTIIDFDDNVESLWRTLRVAETSSTYTLEPQGEFSVEEDEVPEKYMPEL